ncbi:glycosyltransferase involved in cell wall biosynthesis [Mongoliibacter ruber]|uniref:Glycosyltransferase involved in cell wall biosynthesis n=1 Tax=Mongoliibacter ruber TaxID=1750599 RepID=A0A2T0WG89_9BACT|nr:glycosyltransferase involved in cell wall biosynthesis [Mongoliibacter ruber]
MSPVKILFLSKYPRLGASSRLRTFQFQPSWESINCQTKISSFFNEKYLREIYLHQRPSTVNVLFCYFKRFFQILSAWRYDVVWVEKEIFPYLPSYAEFVLNKIGTGYIVDYDDAVFHNYDKHNNPLIKRWMGNKIDWVMRNSKLTIVGNAYLEKRANGAGAKNILRLPTVIDSKKYIKKQMKQNVHPVTIGWMGSPTTVKYLKELLPILEELQKEIPFKLLVANGQKTIDFEGDYECVRWSEETEVSIIHQMDIGIMPLPDDDWEKGKCSYKLIQYMACGLPVVASPVGMNTEVVDHEVTGYLARTKEEWKGYLSKLILDQALRKEIGDRGYTKAHTYYTLERNFELMSRLVFEENYVLTQLHHTPE